MIRAQHVPEYLWSLSTTTGQPSGTFGTSVTPGNNTYGTYAELIDGALVTEDVWKLRINVNSNSVSAALRDTLITVGIDPTAGTSYTDKLTDLMVSDAAAYDVHCGGVWYEFPYFIPAGSSIAVKASVNNGTVGSLRCWMTLYGKPKRPEITPLGTIFRSFGAVTASSRGTLVTPGTASEGAWTQLGSATVEPLWYWSFGYGVGDATMTGMVVHADIGCGDASNKRTIIEDFPIVQLGTEIIGRSAAGAYMTVAAGDLIYGRLQASTTPDTDHSLIAYAIGG